ncbi:MAG: transcription elongation factor GreB [Pseudomonadota bacterium]|jgi:transcription elongation factor GreB
MSKAFTRDGDENNAEVDKDVDASVPGGKNYITPAGAERLRAELKKLRYEERPEVTKVVSWAAGNGDRSENGDYLYGKKRLREIDKRMRFLAKRLEAAEVVDPLVINVEYVQFGATVTIRFEDDSERTYSIVGVDEVDVNRGRISWMSPLAKALLKAKAGDYVTFHSPKGEQEIEVLLVVYRELP